MISIEFYAHFQSNSVLETVIGSISEGRENTIFSFSGSEPVKSTFLSEGKKVPESHT
jgi:hypothetical protein